MLLVNCCRCYLHLLCYSLNEWFQKISIPTLWKSWKIMGNSEREGVGGGGVSTAKFMQESVKLNLLEIPGGQRVQTKKLPNFGILRNFWPQIKHISKVALPIL